MNLEETISPRIVKFRGIVVDVSEHEDGTFTVTLEARNSGSKINPIKYVQDVRIKPEIGSYQTYEGRLKDLYID